MVLLFVNLYNIIKLYISDHLTSTKVCFSSLLLIKKYIAIDILEIIKVGTDENFG